MVLHQTLVFITLYSKVYHTIGKMFIAQSTSVCPIIQECFYIDHQFLSQYTIVYHTLRVVFITPLTHDCFIRQECFHTEELFFVSLCNKVCQYQINFNKLSTNTHHIIQDSFRTNHQCLSHHSIQFITLQKQCHTGLFSHCNSNIVTLCNFLTLYIYLRVKP